MPSHTTLMRYAKVTRPRLFDLSTRAASDAELKSAIQHSDKARLAWATEILKLAKEKPGQLLARYGEKWGVKLAPGGRLPARNDVAEGRHEALAQLAVDPEFLRDLKAMTHFALAAKIAGQDTLAMEAATAVQFLERLPNLSSIVTQELPAPPVLDRFVAHNVTISNAASPVAKPRPRAAVRKSQANEQVRDDLGALWVIRNRYIREKRRQLEQASSDKARPAAAFSVRQSSAEMKAPMPKATKAGTGKSKATKRGGKATQNEARLAEERARREQAAAHFRVMREEAAERKAALDRFKAMANEDTLDAFLAVSTDEVVATVPGLGAGVLDKLKDRLKGHPGYKPGKPTRFCMAWEDLQNAIDMWEPTIREDPIAAVRLTAPTIALADRVDLLGTAELIKVEEQLIGYTEAEISYVENILAGEKRVRSVRSSDEFELIETLTEQEGSSTTSEKQSTSSQSLASEVSSMLQSRFQSDVSSSANASGGGTLGVVNVQGGGTVSMGVGLGVDSSISSTDSNEFGMEIVESARETLTRSTISVRSSRSRRLLETLNSYKIDNTQSPNPSHRRGVYCFLNKHLCVSETPYGVRWFLKAQIAAPGQALLDEGRARHLIATSEIERPPVFELSPADIHPSNYQSLVMRFRAQGVSPPPVATRHLSRTYKCDQSNKCTEEEKGIAKIGKSIMPIIGAYNRYLINDNVEIPDGYMVQEVRLTIDHGANGLSLPVDLPFKLAGGAMMAVPTMLAYPVIMIPVALWQTLMLASPLLHQNTDSSAVIATVGNESQYSNYYFFEPQFLISELLQLFGSFAGAGPGIMAAIQDLLDELPDQLVAQSEQLATAITDTANDVATDVQGVLADIQNIVGGLNAANINVPALISSLLNALGSAASRIAARAPSLDNFFEPLNNFLQGVANILTDAAESAMSDMLAALLASSDSSQLRAYSDSYGFTGALPVSFNIAALKPSVTVNLVACVARTEHALEAWRISTFEKLHQAYLQLLADHDSKVVFGTQPGRAPGTLRLAERSAIKSRVVAALHSKWPLPGASTDIPIERLQLFEHAIDWENISYRTFNYGSTVSVLDDDRKGLFVGIDATHREFLTAAWGEVMLPLSGDQALEQAMLAYFENGSTTIGGGLTNDELASLWQDVITRRSTYAVNPVPIAKREIVVPTDLVVLRSDDSLPNGLPTACTT